MIGPLIGVGPRQCDLSWAPPRHRSIRSSWKLDITEKDHYGPGRAEMVHYGAGRG